MSAVPIPRLARAPAVAALPWLDPLDAAWEDPRLDAVDLLALTQLRRWLYIHPGWWPTLDTLGRLIRKSRQTAARALDRLAAAGYVRPRPDGGYELAAPAPRVGRMVTMEELQGLLFPDEPRPFEADLRPPVDVPPAGRPPHTPLESGSESLKTTTDVVGESSSSFDRHRGEKTPEIGDQLLAELVAETGRVFGFDAGTAEPLIRDTARRFLAETRKRPERREWSRFEAAWLMEALRRADEGRERADVFDWGFLTGILKNIAKRGGPGPAPPPAKAARAAKAAAEAEGRRERERAREEEEARRDAERHDRLRAAWDALGDAERAAIQAAVLADTPQLRRLPKLLEPACLAELETRLARAAPPAHKKPAEGSHANDPPPPADEMYGSSAPAESYPPEEGSARPGPELQTPHDAARVATPPNAAEPASAEPNPTRTAAESAARLLPQNLTSHPCSHVPQIPRSRPAAPDPDAPAGRPRADPGAGWAPDPPMRC